MRMAHRVLIVCFCLCSAAAPFSSVLASPSPPSKIATFSAWDHRFEGPESLPAGETEVRLKNRGKEPHQLQFLKLEEGKSPADLAAAKRRSASWIFLSISGSVARLQKASTL